MRASDDVRAGLRDSVPVLIAIVPFAAVFGVVAQDAGWSAGQALFASAIIFAGASQYLMIELLGIATPAWAVVLSVFVLNVRHVLYSAALTRRIRAFSTWQKAASFFLLVDPLYAAAESRARRTPLQPSYMFAYGLALYAVWMASNVAGVMFGRLIGDPARFGLDFILPLYFVSLALNFRGQANFVIVALASAAASLGAWFVFGNPWHILCGGAVGLAVAAWRALPPEEPNARVPHG